MRGHRSVQFGSWSEFCARTRWPRPGRPGPLLSRVSLCGSWPISTYSRTGCPRPGRHLREALGLCSRTGYDVVLLDCFDSYAWLCAATARRADAITMRAACTCAPRYRSWTVPFGSDPRGNSFGDHDGGQVGVGGGDRRHDGRVGDMQVLDAVYPPACVHDCAAVGSGPMRQVPAGWW